MIKPISFTGEYHTKSNGKSWITTRSEDYDNLNEMLKIQPDDIEFAKQSRRFGDDYTNLTLKNNTPIETRTAWYISSEKEVQIPNVEKSALAVKEKAQWILNTTNGDHNIELKLKLKEVNEHLSKLAKEFKPK